MSFLNDSAKPENRIKLYFCEEVEGFPTTKTGKKMENSAKKLNSNPEFSSLDSPNWITDETIDKYFELISKKDSEFFAFSINFFPCLKKEGYDGVKEWFKEISVFKYKKLFF